VTAEVTVRNYIAAFGTFACLVTGTVSATPFDGFYETDLESCFRSDFSDSWLELSDNTMRTQMALCELSSRTGIRGLDAFLYDADCQEAGNGRWTGRVLLMRLAGSDDTRQEHQLAIYWNGDLSRYAVCIDGRPPRKN
jgi:hypothetical protein